VQFTPRSICWHFPPAHPTTKCADAASISKTCCIATFDTTAGRTCAGWVIFNENWFLVNDQLDAQFFSMYLFQLSTCFEQPRAHDQENQLYQHNIWYMSLCVGDRSCARNGGTQPR
jgi:hypothetical protein